MADALDPDVSLARLPAAFARLGLQTCADLLLYFPLRYEDETHITPISDARTACTIQVQGEVVQVETARPPRRQMSVVLRDASGEIRLRFLHSYPGQAAQMAVGRLIRAVGEVRAGLFGAEMVHPRWRKVEVNTPLTDSLTPVYSVAAGLSQTLLRKHIKLALAQEKWVDTVPETVRNRLKLMGFSDSVLCLHRPSPEICAEHLMTRTHPAWRRIKFDELLAQQLSLRLARVRRRAAGATQLKDDSHLSDKLLANLPFMLTDAQQRVWREIATDLMSAVPMQRLLQGDVGSGKTIVAALAAAQAIGAGFQVVFMAPTELLAEQHYRKLCAWFEPLGISVVWLSGGLSRKTRQAALQDLQQGCAQLAVGTHALFQMDVMFARLGLAVVDEQHRFGVAQRLALRAKGHAPHQLMMSATPIPRTLAMSYHADLDVSVIDELPPGRTPVMTKLVDGGRRDQLIAWVRARCEQGAQVYWVCPLIDESESLQLQTAMDTHAALTVAMPEVSVGLIHGRLRSAEKAEVMAAFTANMLNVLVATTVIEVGVDVPNASLMVIEHAERMGLAQLHQLRGRVGRGAERSVCVLLYHEPLSEMARARLKVIFESTDGFHVAREDLRLRGPGEFLGARQSGAPVLRFADIELDAELVGQARDAADLMLREYPLEVSAHLVRWYGERQGFIQS